MMREIGIGAALAGIVFLAYLGVDLTPLVILGGLAIVMRYAIVARYGGKRFEVLGGAAKGQEAPGVKFSDVGGQEAAKRELIEALDFIKHEEQVRKLGIRPLKGILLAGPPGTGKTLLAKAAANYTGSEFIAASGSEFVEMYAGVGAQRVRQLFADARDAARKASKKSAVVFIDEIDVLGGKRGQHTSHLEYDQTLNQLLVEMDGISPRDDVRVLVLAATNRVDLLDPALLRPGRFDRVVKVDLPDKHGRLHILGIHMKNKPAAPDVDLEAIAQETFGFSGAHLESLVNEAAILAFRAGKDAIGMQELREAVEKVIMGERLDRRPSEEELRRIAVHEVAHALVAETLRPGSVSSVTITSRGNALGYVRQAPEKDMFLYTREQMESQMAMLVAGAAAEEVIFGTRSTGAANDFEQAVSLAKRMIAAGISHLGVVSEADLPRSIYHEAIQTLIKAQEDRARAIVEANASVITSVADILLDRERISGDEFRSIIAKAAAA